MVLLHLQALRFPKQTTLTLVLKSMVRSVEEVQISARLYAKYQLWSEAI